MRNDSASLLSQVRDWIADAKHQSPDMLSADGTGVRIYGDFGGAAYIFADGRIEVEAWDAAPGTPQGEDPGMVTAMLVTASKRRPALAELLPERPSDASDCDVCNATGWVQFGSRALVCGTCHGLGWLPLSDTPVERTNP